MMDLIPKFSSILILVFGSIAGTALIKRFLQTGISVLAGESRKLSHLPSLILGYVVSLLFVVLVQAGIIPLPANLQSSFNQFQTYLLPLISKAVYDTINDIAKKGKPAELAPPIKKAA
jgi:hypothetical protein